MTRSQKLLLPFALLAGAAVPPLALADDEDCTVVDRSVALTPALAEVAATDPSREAAVLSFTASDPEAELRVKLRQDGVRGREDRGRGARGAVRVVEVADGAYRISVHKPQGGDVAFTTERVRATPGALKLRLRAVVADAEGEPVRAHRATVQVRALREVCEAEEDGGTTTGETGTTTGETVTTTGETPTTTGETTADGVAPRVLGSDDDGERGGRRGRGRGRD